MPRLRALVPPAAIATRVLKTAMLPESAADARTAPIYKKHPKVETTVLAGQGQVEFHLRATGATQEDAQAAVDKLAGELEDELGDAVFSSSGESLEQIVGYYCKCAISSWRWPSHAPAEWSPKGSRRWPAVPAISWEGPWSTPTI